MTLHWILYFVGFVISFVILTVCLFRESVGKKQTLERFRKAGCNTELEKREYVRSLWGLGLIPTVFSLVWPFVFALALVIILITTIGWMLDKVVTYVISKEPSDDRL